MRILIVSSEFPPETGGGGIGSYVSALAPALVRRGHEVHVLSCAPGQPRHDYTVGGAFVHRRADRRIRGLGRLVRSSHARVRLERAYSCWQEARALGVGFDVVEGPDWMGEALLIAARRRVPTVAHLHTPLHLIQDFNGLPFDRAARAADRLERLAVRLADAVTSPSKMLADDLTHTGWVRQHVEIVRFPIDLEVWCGAPSPVEAPAVVAQIGRLEPRKAPEQLLWALALLAPSVGRVKGLFIGRNAAERNGRTYRTWLEEEAQRLNVDATFVDQVDRQEIPSLLADVRVAVLPSRYENFGLAGLEAMAAGRPLICSEYCGIAEIVADSGGGAVVPVGDHHRLADALHPYLSDPVLAAEAGRRARRAVERECHPDKVAARREAIYIEAIEVAKARQRRLTADFPHAAPLARRRSPRWHSLMVDETVSQPWKHFCLRTAEQLLELLEVHPAFAGRHSFDGLRILDLAATPHVSVALACCGADVTMLDWSAEEAAKTRDLARSLGVAGKVFALRADAFRVPLVDAQFDLVWNSGFIEHFDDPVAIVEIMGRLTRPGGAVCVLTPAPMNPHSWWIRNWLRRQPEGYYWDRAVGPERSYSRRDLERIMRAAEIEVLHSKTANLRRSWLDDSVVLPRVERLRSIKATAVAINVIDLLESSLPVLAPLGFTAGVVGIVRSSTD